VVRVTAEFAAWQAAFLPSVAEQFGVAPATIAVIERELDGFVDDAPYQALVASLASGTFEGRPVRPAPVAPPRPSPLLTDINAAVTLDDVKAVLRKALVR
jgi:hypothetical protein